MRSALRPLYSNLEPKTDQFATTPSIPICVTELENKDTNLQDIQLRPEFHDTAFENVASKAYRSEDIESCSSLCVEFVI